MGQDLLCQLAVTTIPTDMSTGQCDLNISTGQCDLSSLSVKVPLFPGGFWCVKLIIKTNTRGDFPGFPITSGRNPWSKWDLLGHLPVLLLHSQPPSTQKAVLFWCFNTFLCVLSLWLWMSCLLQPTCSLNTTYMMSASISLVPLVAFLLISPVSRTCTWQINTMCWIVDEWKRNKSVSQVTLLVILFSSPGRKNTTVL